MRTERRSVCRFPISRELSVPIAILWGAEDRILPAAQAQRLRAGFDVRILEGAGHMLPFEALAEIIALIEALPG